MYKTVLDNLPSVLGIIIEGSVTDIITLMPCSCSFKKYLNISSYSSHSRLKSQAALTDWLRAFDIHTNLHLCKVVSKAPFSVACSVV